MPDHHYIISVNRAGDNVAVRVAGDNPSDALSRAGQVLGVTLEMADHIPNTRLIQATAPTPPTASQRAGHSALVTSRQANALRNWPDDPDLASHMKDLAEWLEQAVIPPWADFSHVDSILSQRVPSMEEPHQREATPSSARALEIIARAACRAQPERRAAALRILAAAAPAATQLARAAGPGDIAEQLAAEYRRIGEAALAAAAQT